MYIRNYTYLKPTKFCYDHYEIEGITRDGYAVNQFIDMVDKIVLDRTTAVLYAPGAGIGQSESRNPTQVHSRYAGSVPLMNGGPLIKELTAYHLHKWIGSMENNERVVYASVNANTCASSMYAVYEAERLLREKVVDEVIVITDERTSFNTIRIFKEHNIPLIVGDGLAIVRFVREPVGIEVTDTKWSYEWNRNPFGVTRTGYLKIDSIADTVNTHGTGTENNETAELAIHVGRDTVAYKGQIGHTQGASGLLEMCMVLDDDTVHGDVLCVASGLGCFYGSCILHKN